MSSFIERMKPVCRNLHLFVFPSRINRIKYLSECTVNLLITFAALLILEILFFITNLLFGSSPLQTHGIIKELTFCIPGIILIANQVILAVNRLHDINLKGWWILLIIIPTLFYFIVCIIPGTKGDNRFGAQPEKATKAEYFLAALPILLVVIYFVIYILLDLYFPELIIKLKAI
ncbi:hypothetical protein I862_03255 [endosymbiont of Acanthamoeba sp. UWC8]|uniref:DUF805 domain-containing protein n=1 Tax=endosymbiont of Acanthamoeba sp. UWC8 TaxID=86106 RepID=UPI0004D14C8E|nr:DUF805 domain-containing protein [endosymbiont of Acanthamoeba sp. UWC8]AIF81211.1 hypothetical protein I862_03255 [endosymbiont of Acanthamoeba sp. UWC8]